MFQVPRVNTWYMTPANKLFKVRLLAYDRTGLTAVAIEHMDGTTQIISMMKWSQLELDIYTRALPRREPAESELST